MLDGESLKNKRQTDSDGIVITGKRPCQIMILVAVKKIVSLYPMEYKEKFEGVIDLRTPCISLISFRIKARAWRELF
jgi:hypothetical protein